MRWGKPEQWEDHKKDEEEEGPPKELPSFEPSGKLAVDTNTYKGVVIKYNEPPEAKIPRIRWRLYPFKVNGDAQTARCLIACCYREKKRCRSSTSTANRPISSVVTGRLPTSQWIIRAARSSTPFYSTARCRLNARTARVVAGRVRISSTWARRTARTSTRNASNRSATMNSWRRTN